MGWLSGWRYRRPITINNDNDYYTSYSRIQVMIELTSSFWSESGNKVKSDGSDIRFTKSDGTTTLYYYIETWNYNNYARIWVDTPLNYGSNTIYMYYGNPDATSQSNPYNTFPYYTSFSSTTGWTEDDPSNVGSAYISSGQLKLQVSNYANWTCSEHNYRYSFYKTFTRQAKTGIEFEVKYSSSNVYSSSGRQVGIGVRRTDLTTFHVWGPATINTSGHRTFAARSIGTSDCASDPNQQYERTGSSTVSAGSILSFGISINSNNEYFYWLIRVNYNTGWAGGQRPLANGVLNTVDAFTFILFDVQSPYDLYSYFDWGRIRYEIVKNYLPTQPSYSIGNEEAQAYNWTWSGSESITLSDLLAKILIFTRSFEEALLLQDVMIYSHQIARTLEEAIAFLDTVARIGQLHRYYDEILSLQDQITAFKSRGLTLEESVSLLDRISKVISKIYEEEMSLSDSVIARHGRTKELEEAVSLLDKISTLLSHYREITEKIRLIDSLSVLLKVAPTGMIILRRFRPPLSLIITGSSLTL